jgi:hypothetical protein
MTSVQAFNTEECKPPELLNSRVGSLSSADDLLNIIESKEGLQNSVNKLNMFCDNWQLTLNVVKTKKLWLFSSILVKLAHGSVALVRRSINSKVC